MNNEIKFSSNSMFDDFGRVFFYEDKVYRAISKNAISDCLSLIAKPFFVELTNRGLFPKTTVSELKVEGVELVLEHERLFNIEQQEWTFSMLKDAALAVLEIQDVLSSEGYELKDAHTMNVLFRGSQPVYVDIGSIQKREGLHWCAYEEFLNSFYVPLSIWENKNYYITRKILESKFYRMQTIPDQKISESGLYSFMKDSIRYATLEMKGKILATSDDILEINNRADSYNRKIASVKRSPSYVFKSTVKYYDQDIIKERLKNKIYPNSDSLWKGYHSKFYGEKGVQLSDRFERILDIIKNINDKEPLYSVLDLAGNEGLMSFCVKERLNIPQVSLCDYDENALEKACQNRRSSNIDINILLLNFMFPPNLENVSSRAKSDLVMALAVTHHLILTGKYLISTIFERISSYSNKYVLIEFMPKGLWSIEHKEDVSVPDFYTQDWFKSEFEKYFDIILIEELEENRVMFVGKKKI